MTAPDWTEFTVRPPFLRLERVRALMEAGNSLEKIANARHIGRRRRRMRRNVGEIK
jgi:hypothetical protein